MAKKRGFYAGAWDAFGFMGFTAEVAKLVMAQRIKDSGEYKKMGYDTWDECCNEQFRCSDVTMDKKLKALKETGPQTLSACRELGFEWKEIRLLSMPDQAENLKQGFLMIEDKKVPITLENAELIRLYVGNVEKDKKIAKTKVEGIEKEHKKEVKAYTAEIEGLKAMLPDPEDPSAWALTYMESIGEMFNQFDLALRRFAFDKRAFEEPVVPAKINSIIELMSTRLRELRKDFNIAMHEEWGEDV